MRLAENQIREALLHPDEEVRCTAVCWYSEGFSRDPSVMPESFPGFDRRYEKAAAAQWGRERQVVRLADDYFEPGPWPDPPQ